MDVASHAMNFNQSGSIISEYSNCSNYEICLRDWVQIFALSKTTRISTKLSLHEKYICLAIWSWFRHQHIVYSIDHWKNLGKGRPVATERCNRLIPEVAMNWTRLVHTTNTNLQSNAFTSNRYGNWPKRAAQLLK